MALSLSPASASASTARLTEEDEESNTFCENSLEFARIWTTRLASLPRDLRGLYRYLKLQYRIRRAKRLNQSVPKIFREVAGENAEKVAFYFEEETWTFKEVDEYSNRVGNYFSAQGIGKGDSVALFMENRVEYVCIWLGLTKIGCVPALINFHLRQEPLKHCIRVAKRCKAVVVGAELQDDLAPVLDEDDLRALPVFVSGKGNAPIKIAGGIDVDEGLKNASSQVPPELEAVGFVDDMVYIYTSGTTGLPKAAVIKHSRAYFAALGMGIMVGVQSSPKDGQAVLYDALPLYHTAGGIIGVGQALFLGVSVVLRKKFSASAFWTECCRYKCTAAQYIGEICRYLYNLPPKPEDTQHNVRIMFGNGLRPTLWEDFQKRFAIPTISEFYGSTEGNANIINIDGRKGAVGFVSVLFPSVYPVALLKIDQDTGEILRGADGLCIRCKPGEAGEFVGKIVRGDPVRDFHGYADEAASKKKVVKDVFRKGDAAFLSGDILVMDEEGYLYFKDRTGDTYRWKGENVSTAEVEAIVSGAVGNADVVVYGVEVPGAEGRAGMAAIEQKDNQELDLTALYAALESSLAAYARPLFIRAASALERTGTFKLKKVTLQKDGFNPKVVNDPIYFLDGKNKKFVPLTEQLYHDIVEGRPGKMVESELMKANRDESFKTFLWNPETKQFLGRTGSSWLKIGIFYLIFYACLAGFFAIIMAIFYQTLDVNHLPKYTPGGGGSILKNPAMGFRPLPRAENVESTLIWYKNGDSADIKHWVDSLNEFIKPYEGTSDVISGQHVTDCSEDKLPAEGEVCRFQDTWLTGKCQKAESWGYNRESPCILLKLNKMINWVPDVYTSVEELPKEMPDTLKEHIQKRTTENQGKVPKMIWVSCKGENPADEEYVGPIVYSPWQGFPAYYFPYMHTPGYLSPIVAVQFEQPQSNVLINIECRAWAKNIVHDRGNRLGLVHFELLKD